MYARLVRYILMSKIACAAIQKGDEPWSILCVAKRSCHADAAYRQSTVKVFVYSVNDFPHPVMAYPHS